LVLVDAAPVVAAALRASFGEYQEVSILQDDILQVAHGAVVSPANSYGYMDGGVDAAYAAFFGQQLEKRVLQRIDRDANGMLPVGAALLIETEHPRIPFLIVAPTMELPRSGDATKVFFAMAAILNLVNRYPGKLQDVYCPGLGTGVGAVEPERAASEMASAYAKWKIGASSAAQQ
jgi:O-acetyl-ADP-ribose deacetylase (regulator of RNase III)